MRKVLFALGALFALTAAPLVYADEGSLPDIPAVDSQEQLPPLTDSGDGK